MKSRRSLPTVCALATACAIICSAVAYAQTWSSPQFVANGFAVAVATNGTTSAVLFTPSSGGLQASVKSGASWQTPVTMTTAGATGDIAVASNGDVLAVWSFRTTNTYTPVEAQARFYSAGHWGNTITISANVYGNVSSLGLPAIGFDGSSQATLVWEEITNPSPIACGLKAVTGNASSGFGSTQTITTDPTCYGLVKISVNSTGQAVVVEGAPGILSAAILGISRSSTGTWAAPVTVAPYAYRQDNPSVGLGNDGTAVAVWRTRTGVSYAVRSNGAWSTAAGLPVLSGQAGGSAGVAVDGSGNAVAIFTQVTIGPGTYATYRPVNGSWQTKVQLSSGLPVAATPAGTFVASGTTVSTRMAGTSNWTTHTFADNARVNAGPGLAIAAVGPQVSISTAAVP
ncbi:MAG TPA: hypothetical protein VMS18_21970 [Candidatus Binatia bacterium]|nr:hypothetical protein [Candidatus Binatia bacterium]